jgi:DNA ligase 4
VLKGCNYPYFSLNGAKAFIKLKKDYIVGLGDTADFAIVSRHHNARDE